MTGPTKGMIAISWVGGRPPDTWPAACRELGPPDTQQVVTAVGTSICVVGLDDSDTLDGRTGVARVQLTRGARVHDRDVTAADITTWLTPDSGHPDLAAVLPPFAALHRRSADHPIRVATDYLGFRHVYHCAGEGWAALSTSARALGRLLGSSLDEVSLAVFSLIGWQLETRTIYSGVSKLPAGAVATLRSGRLAVTIVPTPTSFAPYPRLEDAVDDAAAFLRTTTPAFLEDHPDSWLQLTGGLDSRLLLGAIAPDRRQALQVMTLSAPGNPDSDIAAGLAARYGMTHHVVPVPEPGTIDSDRAHDLSLEGARRVECSSDPLAWASLAIAESALPQRPRLAGLGGEVVRGFYYVGPALPLRNTPRRVRQLAHWRLFPNEGVPAGALEPEFASWRHEATMSELQRIFRRLPRRWDEATDAFYLWQRMQRWAGATTTSTCQDRFTANVMLDPRFITIGSRVPPRWKAGMRFLSGILCRLDPTLAAIPLDGRPAPTVYAHPTVGNRARLAALTVDKARRKVTQRLRADTRPAAGGTTLAELVIQRWRRDPKELAGVAGSSVVNMHWLDRVLHRQVEPAPSAVSFLVTLAAAAPVGMNDG